MLIGTKIRLRPVTTEDAQLIADWENDPAHWGQYVNHWPTTRQEWERRITASTLPDWHGYVMVDQDTAEPMGRISYWNPFTMAGFY